MQIDLDSLAYPGKHPPVFAPHGVVATSQPLAAQAGLTMLQQGGNAVDAALAAAIALTVVEPASNGLGGDTFALVWDGAGLYGLNGSGRAPAALTADRVRGQGHTEMPELGWLPVTVPGTPAAWRDLHTRFGRLPFADLFAPAIRYAEGGYPVSPIAAWHWRWAVDNIHAELTGAEYAAWSAIFAPAGRSPRVGEWWSSPALAHTLREIARSHAADFYEGALAAAIDAFAAQTGGLLTAADLAAHTSTWVAPISISYRGYDVWELPPNGQGLAALAALNILEGYDFAAIPRESTARYHLQIEAMKLAFADAYRYIADPDRTAVPVADLLSKAYAAERRALITEEAGVPAPGRLPHSDTVYLCAADADGMMVSLIQSHFGNFGAHIAVPETGIVLQNRGSGFALAPDHPNRLEPGKRPFHTIIPGFLTQEGQAVGPFGVMGGRMQPQGHVQMIANTLDYGLDPQTSLDAPRWFWWEDRYVKLEPGVDPGVVTDLEARGHEIEIDPELDAFGCGQIIWRLPGGGYMAGSDGRTDGQAVGY